MNNSNIIPNIRIEIDKLVLADDYRNKSFTKNFNAHLNSLIDTSIVLSGEASSILSSHNVEITNSIYWQTEGFILEKLDDVVDVEVIGQLDELENVLYDKIIKSLGKNYDKSSTLNKMIDNTVHNTLMAIKFNFFSRYDEFLNPWQDAKNILFENSVLHTFYTNFEEFISLGYNNKSNESEVTKYKKIGVLGKGNKDNFTYGTVRDLIGLRNTVIDILEEKANSGKNPIKTDILISELRRMGISEADLSDGNIINWLISPLKRNNKIGSCREGYFLMNNCSDVSVSYKSHLENLRGYYNTLENHRKLALKYGCSNSQYEEHRKLFSNDLELNNGD